MCTAIHDFPAQCAEAVSIGRAFEMPALAPKNVVITGLGGSAIGADLLRSYVAPLGMVPIIQNRSYDLPAFVNADTLVMVCSYSGNTEETVSAFDQARARGAQVVLYSTGGHLGETASAHRMPWCRLPGGLQPRAALGLSFFPMLLTLARLRLIPDRDQDIRNTLNALAGWRDRYAWDAPHNQNMARRLAIQWADRLPVVYGSYGPIAAVAYRWKCQINENAKGLALWNEFPELNHNETVGWSGIPALNRNMSVVMLGTPGDPPRIRKRMELTQTLVASQAAHVETVLAEGANPLAWLFHLVHLGDWASFYLAVQRNQDPVEVRAIDNMKAALAKGD
jgi:glucose/mannose-6-phosphate isomerase